MQNKNHLANETSPYLLQHANNPVNWYPWCNEAFKKAKEEDKPVFLSIGYSTCHWCHVMAKESFEDVEVAKVLNEKYIAIKVDKEERPDIDSIYMNVCTAFTGSGGWPLTIIMTPEQKPFFAGTYFPKYSIRGMAGLIELLISISEEWKNNKLEIMNIGNTIVNKLKNQTNTYDKLNQPEKLIEKAVNTFKQSFDSSYGGFGVAPKFPTPHNLLFLLKQYEIKKDKEILNMVEKTLTQMYKGGIFDHIGFGFSRYSTDRYWLAPHFEKMLYDNALLCCVYLEAYRITKNKLYKDVATKMIDYVLRELTNSEGGFFSAQDADSDHVEGKYYLFTPDEIIDVLGQEDGEKFNSYFDITKKGNFEGKNIPNLIKNENYDEQINKLNELLPKVYSYRINRTKLHKDDKILTSWNSLMIFALAKAYRILNDEKYLNAAISGIKFIEKNLYNNGELYVSFRDGKKSNKGFLDDYAFYILAQIEMHEATLENVYLEKAIFLTNKAISDFWDSENTGFYFYGINSEQLVLKPKETYDGAIPSGNSVMAYNLIKLSRIANIEKTKNTNFDSYLEKQLNFLASNASDYPAGYSFYMYSLLIHIYNQKEIVCVLKDSGIKNDLEKLKSQFNSTIIILNKPTKEYPLKDNKTTFYICENNACKPPTNNL